MIVVKNLCKSFGRLKAINNVNFCIKKGEVAALLGPNGAGKTTLMRMISGYLPPDLGSISLNGYDMSLSRIEAEKNLGYVPENGFVYGDMSVFEFLKFRAELRGMAVSDFRKSAAELVESLELTEVINQRIDTLSKGFKRRTGLAGALVYRPRLLVLDEPTEGLDPNQKFKVRQFIKDYGRKNIVLVSTHIMEEVEAMADRVILLNRGKLVRDTTPLELKKAEPGGDISAAFRRITAEVGGK